MKQEWIEIGGILLCAGMFLAATEVDVSHPSRGDWEMNTWSRGDTVNLELKRVSLTSRWVWSFDQPLAELHGLTRDQMRSAHAPVKFTLDRDAGSFVFEGNLVMGLGGGHFQFVSNPSFIGHLRDLGYGYMSNDELLHFAMSDISLAFARQVKEAGVQTNDARDLRRLKDHGVGLDFIREIGMLGYSGFTAEDLTRLKDHGVDIAFMRAIQDAGYGKFRAEEITRLRDHGLDAAFLRGMRHSGWTASCEDLVRLRDHGVSADFVKSLTDAGYKNLRAEEITKLRDHGVDNQYIARLSASGFKDLSVEQIVKLRDHGID